MRALCRAHWSLRRTEPMTRARYVGACFLDTRPTTATSTVEAHCMHPRLWLWDKTIECLSTPVATWSRRYHRRASGSNNENQ